MHLGQFAADRGVARAHDRGEIGERLLHAIAGFEQHQRGIYPGEFGEPRAPRLRLRRQKSLEEEPVGRQRRDRQRRQHRRWRRERRSRQSLPTQASRTSLKPGSEINGVPASETSATEAPCANLLQNFRPRLRRVVLVIGRELGRDRVALGQSPADAGILAGDDVDAGQRFQRAQRDVAEMANRGRHQMQAWSGSWRGQDMALKRKSPGTGLGLAFSSIARSGFWAHNGNLEGWPRERHMMVVRAAGVRATHEGGETRSRQLATPPRGRKPFVLVNYSPTICLNPSP